MPLAKQLIPAAERQGGGEKAGSVVDTLILTYAQRTAQRGFVFGVKGTCVEFAFAEPVLLRTDDALVLDDGSFVEVVADAEPVLEARLADAAAMARLAWQLGSLHVPVEVKSKSVRVRREGPIEELLAALGVKFTAIEAPFEPVDIDAIVADHHHHDHHHDDHHHHHHDHGHGHAHHRHDHDHHHHDHGHSHDHGKKRG